ncbi:MAG: MFS transporter [Isosphaeraceae bacterium]
MSTPVITPTRTLRDISAAQWKSGVAAWLGWMFDGLDMHLYTLVAAPFVAQLLVIQDTRDPSVGWHSSIIQAGFLLGWALGGGFFGRLGDAIGRSRALSLTILTYALFTGLSSLAQTWWHLLILRFVAALGIGGEWAVGASLLSETWPRRWRPWIAAVLQTGVNVGVLLASITTFVLAGWNPRVVFLVGVLPALLVFWIRREVPEPEEWHQARASAREVQPRIRDLFRSGLRPLTWLLILVCATSLTAHWAFMFWYQQQLRNLPDLAAWSAEERNRLASTAMFIVMLASIAGNFGAAWLSCRIGYRRSIAFMSLGYMATMLFTYATPRDHLALMVLLPIISLFSGLFALYTMYLPPLFPTLLRTTGAGFCYNIGRIFAAVGTVCFGLLSSVGDYRTALLAAGCLFLPAGILAFRLPELSNEEPDLAEGVPLAEPAE